MILQLPQGVPVDLTKEEVVRTVSKFIQKEGRHRITVNGMYVNQNELPYINDDSKVVVKEVE